MFRSELIYCSVFIEECVLANWREHESKPGRTDKHWMDPHWAPVINRCSVCERDEEHQLDYYSKVFYIHAIFFLSKSDVFGTI